MTGSELLDSRRSLLLVIDLQGKLMEMIHRPALVVQTTCRLVRFAGIYRVPVLLTEQYPQGLGPTHPEVRAAYDRLDGTKAYLDKTTFGCCGDQQFGRQLEQLLPGVPPAERQVVVAGIEAHVCVIQTVIELLRQGTQVHLCWECVSGRGEEYRRHALQRMQQAGAVITNHESVGFEWARDTSHSGFKEMSAILKEGQPT